MAAPLIRSAGRGQYDAVLALLTEQPSLLNSQDADGVTALMAASGQGHLKLVTELLDRGADIDLRTKGEVSLSAFLLGVQGGHTTVVEALLAKGADVNDRDSGTGMTALMVAAAKGHVALVRVLLSRGADPNAKSKEGHSAMTFARKDETRYSKDQLRPYMEIAELLKSAGSHR